MQNRTRLNAALSLILARNRKRERSGSNNVPEKAYDIQQYGIAATAGTYYVLHTHLGVPVDIARDVRINFREIVREPSDWIGNLHTPLLTTSNYRITRNLRKYFPYEIIRYRLIYGT